VILSATFAEADGRSSRNEGGGSAFSTTSLSLRTASSQPAGEQAAEKESGAEPIGFEDADVNPGCDKCGAPPWLCSGHPLTGDWGGHRTKLKDKGINVSAVLTTGFFHNFRGGLETHNANASSGDLRLNLLLDFDKMGWVPGGFFFFRLKSGWNNGVQADVGSLGPEQWVYGSGGDEEVWVDKWWYGQRLLDNRLEFRAGRLLTPVDLFDAAAYAKLPWDQFSNAALNRNPTVPHRKSLGAYLKIKFTDWLDFAMAGVDADQTDPYRCADVTSTFHGEANFIGLWELNFRPKLASKNGDLPGNYAFGWWYDGRTKSRFINDLGGALAPRKKSGHAGWYLTFDQLLWKENDQPECKQGLGAFLRYGFAHPEYNRVSHFWSVGAQYQGLLPSRDKDVLAFGVAQSIMSKTLRHNLDSRMDRETVYELYYAYHLTCWCVITPDLQFVVNPGGSKDARDSIIGGVRVRIAF
jgi:porin